MSHLLTAITALVLYVKSTECSSVQKVSGFDPFQKIEAENFDIAYNSTICQNCSGDSTVYLCSNYHQSTVGYYGLDFQKGAVRFNYRFASLVTSGSIFLFLDEPLSEPIFSTWIPWTGGQCQWNTTSTLLLVPAGVHDLYVAFDDYNQTHPLVDVDWFYFDATTGNETQLDAFQLIQAENYSYAKWASPEVCPVSNVGYLGGIRNNAVIGYYGVNFSSGAQVIQIRVASWDSGTLFVHLDSPNVQPFAHISIQKVGTDIDSCNFFVLEQFVSIVPTGVHDVFFTPSMPREEDSFVNIDWFTFKQSTT